MSGLSAKISSKAGHCLFDGVVTMSLVGGVLSLLARLGGLAELLSGVGIVGSVVGPC